jgi:hypothetical protein
MRSLSYRFWGLAFALVIGLAMIPKTKILGSPDFKVFYVAARHVIVDPENLYRVSPDRYLYPPSAAVLLTPFAITDNFEFFRWAWHGMLMVLLGLLSGVSGAALAAMLVLTRYLLNTLGYGQINLFVLSLLALAGWALSRRKLSLAGGAWAIATGFKVYPAVFGLAFLPKKRWPALLWGLGVGALLLLLPILVFGPSLAGQLYQEFFHALRDKGSPLHSHNQSIQALVMRLFSGQSFPLHSVGETNWSVMVLPEMLVRAAAYLLGAVLVALSWKKAKKVDDAWSAGAFTILFLSHIVWKDYLLFLYFPLRQLFATLPKKQAWALGMGFLVLVTVSSMDVVGAPLASRLDAACIHLWAAILVWCVWIKR